MTVGETLTEARNEAGLSVDELSERTRIRGTIIRSIEQDDYDACGGDLYVRGYVRAIAGAVGIDAQPLIREYDEARSSGQYERANGSTGRHAAADADATRFDLSPVGSLAPVTAEPPAFGGSRAARQRRPGRDRVRPAADHRRHDLPAARQPGSGTRSRDGGRRAGGGRAPA